MNQDNYCSLEVSKKLADAGIVLEVDAYWCLPPNATEWELLSVDESPCFGYGEQYPAPCFAELWRELPWFVLRCGEVRNLQVEKYATFTVVCYDGTGPSYTSANPTDALAELLIWAKGQEAV